MGMRHHRSAVGIIQKSYCPVLRRARPRAMVLNADRVYDIEGVDTLQGNDTHGNLLA